MTSREWTFQIEGSEHVTGMTSGLREVTIQPVRLTMTEHAVSGTVTAAMEGPRIKADGTPGESYVRVKVTVTETDGGTWKRYPQAPEWVQKVYREVM